MGEFHYTHLPMRIEMVVVEALHAINETVFLIPQPLAECATDPQPYMCSSVVLTCA